MPDFTLLWRDLTVGLALPDRAFGAAVDVDSLLIEPELHFAATPTSSRLMLMPRLGTFARLLLEWETLPEIGIFTASQAFLPEKFDEEQLRRLETWMRDVAVVLHANRDRIREAAERVVRDAAQGLDRSLPTGSSAHTHVVSAHVGTRVTGPAAGASHAVVDVIGPVADTGDTDISEFTDRVTGVRLGRRLTRRADDEVVEVVYLPLAEGVTETDLVLWYDQHIFREVLFDDVWQVYVHLIAGLDAPANVVYFGS
ncbi:MAG: hypothetical protein JWP75_680 [Frondihabitans sp.]|nr:hypothetical protein [Frondihabitans sp.]